MADTSKRVKRLIREYATSESTRQPRMRRRSCTAPSCRSPMHSSGGNRVNSTAGAVRTDPRFHQGRAREIYVRYNTNHLAPPLAYAIATGVVDRASVLPRYWMISPD